MTESPEAECTWHEYIDHYLEPMRDLCRLKMAEDPRLCVEKVSRPFYYWAEECKRLRRLPPIP